MVCIVQGAAESRTQLSDWPISLQAPWYFTETSTAQWGENIGNKEKSTSALLAVWPWEAAHPLWTSNESLIKWRITFRILSNPLSLKGYLSVKECLLKVKSLSHVRLFATPWTVAHQDPVSMGFFRQEYWSGLPFPSPGDLPYPGIELRSPVLQADALTSEPPGKPLTD